MTPLLKIIGPGQIPPRAGGVLDTETMSVARRIIDDVRDNGWDAVVNWSRQLGDGDIVVHGRAALDQAAGSLDAQAREVMMAAAARIRAFAQAQRGSISDLRCEIPGGAAGHWLTPVQSAGCYAPGGRFPLPSSVLMTVIAARVAGVARVIVASPKPTAHTLAAAGIAGADALVSMGGAQAVAALALGAGPVEPCDIIVGPGNRFVTAAKKLLFGVVGIDMLAGPSEVLVIADDTADARLVAADLLAQAEHDADARAIFVTTQRALADAVSAELDRQIRELPTADVARRALANSFAVVCGSMDECVEVASRIAPEHLELMTRDPESVARRVMHFGAAFIGPASAEVLGDYGAGPNHVLPTAGAARFSAGLSVFTFLRMRTWMKVDNPTSELLEQTAAFARMEGLEAHARAAEARRAIPNA